MRNKQWSGKRSNFDRNYSYTSVTPRRRGSLWKILLFLLLATIFVVLLYRTLFSGKPLFGKVEVVYDSSLSQAEIDYLSEIIHPEDLKSSITITAADVNTAPKPTDAHTIIMDVWLPTTDFYDVRSNVTSDDSDITYKSITEVLPTEKVLALDGTYYFDSFASGGKFRTLTFEGSEVEETLEKVKKSLKIPTKDTTLSITQSGVTALTRAMIGELSRQGGDATYFSREIRDLLGNADYTHLSNEVSFADDCVVDSGSTTLCSPVAMLEVIKDVNADIIELTGNHNNDYGAAANLSTIDTYKKLGMLTFGGGADAEAAAQPLSLNSKNNRVTLLGYNNSTSTVANGQGASGDRPGANIYDEETAAADIAAAKAQGDFVIVDVQYFECYCYPENRGEYPACDAPISGQEEFFKHLIDLGADMVVGTQAHQPQTFELYNGKPIYYGLGNLFFDQTYWPDTTRGYILTHYFYNGKLLQTRISPHQYDDTYQTKLMDEEDSQWFLSRLAKARND